MVHPKTPFTHPPVAPFPFEMLVTRTVIRSIDFNCKIIFFNASK